MAAFEDLGAEVRVGADCDNLVRRTESGFEVQSQGLPNLIHELVHATVQGGLDDDHGFPYGEIPLDMRRADHRAQLHEELCCCVLSCAFVDAEQRDAWFSEQVEILPVFYGLEDNPDAFAALVESTLLAHPGEAGEMRARARAALDARLEAGARRLGLDSLCLESLDWPEFETLWGRFRDGAGR